MYSVIRIHPKQGCRGLVVREVVLRSEDYQFESHPYLSHLHLWPKCKAPNPTLLCKVMPKLKLKITVTLDKSVSLV